MCQVLGDITPHGNAYAPPPSTPKGWANVTIVRERTVQPPPAHRMRMQVESPDGGLLGELSATTEPDERPAGHVVHVATELQLCGKCLEQLVKDPNLSRRIAQDDTRVERAVLLGPGMP
jgi:hypothetical protein